MAVERYTVGDLHAAIDRGQIVPYFQPIVALNSGKLWGFEMLARWQHPENGLVSPDRFIPLAESSSLIRPLFESLMVQTFQVAATLPNHLIWSANLVASQMIDHSLPGWFQSTASSHHVSLHQITVELTETGLIQDFELSNLVACELKEMGVRLAIDDFGTGYSSLMYVSSLPLDELKIDQHFVFAMSDQSKSRKIAGAIASLGQSLGVVTVAEGVETRENADMLYYLGCTLGQGYLFGRPMPASELSAVVEKKYLATPPASALLATTLANSAEVAPTLQMAHLKALYDCLPIGLLFLDRNLRYVSVNRWWTDRVSYPGKPRLGRSMAEVLPPKVFKLYEPYMRKALDGEPTINLVGDPDRIDYVPYGHHFIDSHVLLYSYYPVRDETGEIVGALICILDITKQYRAERDLHYQTAQYLKPLQEHAISLYTADAEGFINWFGMTRLGLSDQDLIGNNWQNRLHPDERERVVANWLGAVKRPEPHQADFRFRGSDGTWHLLRSHAVPRFGDHGEIIGWSGLLRDLGPVDQKANQPAATPPPTAKREKRRPHTPPPRYNTVH